MDERLAYEILSAVGEIPEGKVATYGQVPGSAGREKNAVGGKSAEPIAILWRVSCHRVVNHIGRLAPIGQQADLLRAEGVSMKDATHVVEKVPVGLLMPVQMRNASTETTLALRRFLL